MKIYLSYRFGIILWVTFAMMMVFTHHVLAQDNNAALPQSVQEVPVKYSDISQENSHLNGEENAENSSLLSESESKPSSSRPHPITSFTQVFISLGFVIFLILLVTWFLKRTGYSGHHAHSYMAIKASLPLSNKEKLLIVEVGDEQIVIGVSPGSISHIQSLDTPLDFTHKNTKESFASVFDQLIKGKKSRD